MFDRRGFWCVCVCVCVQCPYYYLFNPSSFLTLAQRYLVKQVSGVKRRPLWTSYRRPTLSSTLGRSKTHLAPSCLTSLAAGSGREQADRRQRVPRSVGTSSSRIQTPPWASTRAVQDRPAVHDWPHQISKEKETQAQEHRSLRGQIRHQPHTSQIIQTAPRCLLLHKTRVPHVDFHDARFGDGAAFGRGRGGDGGRRRRDGGWRGVGRRRWGLRRPDTPATTSLCQSRWHTFSWRWPPGLG
ncbi:hypothetical protein GBAR_LOCUS1179 [Geodia barretti]|uniref:Uncharacterized protein n=1 Tax=Geodia barretti TaxID=519541 RepID=A0AA35VUN3_GEOBA|nr:hypothetical protein GBAR_LOCUS1179 [Geodia barretti]